MKHLLVIGAGKSTGVLIEYLLSEAERHDWSVRVVDRFGDAARRRVGDHPRGTAEEFDASDGPRRDTLVSAADLVVSLRWSQDDTGRSPATRCRPPDSTDTARRPPRSRSAPQLTARPGRSSGRSGSDGRPARPPAAEQRRRTETRAPRASAWRSVSRYVGPIAGPSSPGYTQSSIDVSAGHGRT